jgi:hypothetical protein
LVSGTRGREFESRIAHHIQPGNKDILMAMSIKKKVTLLICSVAILYFLLSNHIIITGQGIGNIRLLKKSTYTLQYTIFSIIGKSNKKILSIDALRKDGIGELLKEEGLMGDEEEAIILEVLATEGYQPDQPF